jgi:hypothetical protein
MRLNKQIFEQRKKLFQDYCNARDQVKETREAAYIELSPKEVESLLNFARRRLQKRELEISAMWFRKFTAAVSQLYDKCIISSVPNVYDWY